MAKQTPDGCKRVFVIACSKCGFVTSVEVDEQRIALRRAYSKHVNHVNRKPLICRTKKRKFLATKSLRQE